MHSNSTFRFLVGPPVAGALDDRFGFRAPFILGVIITSIEFLCRLLIIERQDAKRWDGALRGLTEGKKSNFHDRAYGATDAEKRKEQPAASGAVSEGQRESAAILERASSPRSQSSTSNESEQHVKLSLLGLLVKLIKSPRAMAPVMMTLVYALVIFFVTRMYWPISNVTFTSIVITSQEPALPLYLQSTYGLDVSKVGLVYIAAVVPSFICQSSSSPSSPRVCVTLLYASLTPTTASPLTGWYADRGGTIMSTLVCLVCNIPFYILIFIKGPLAYFIAMFACLSECY